MLKFFNDEKLGLDLSLKLLRETGGELSFYDEENELIFDMFFCREHHVFNLDILNHTDESNCWVIELFKKKYPYIKHGTLFTFFINTDNIKDELMSVANYIDITKGKYQRNKNIKPEKDIVDRFYNSFKTVTMEWTD